MGTTLISVIGSLLVFMLGLLLYLVKSARDDIIELEQHIDKSLIESGEKILERVKKPECIREMDVIRLDLKDIVRDIRELERKN